MVHTLRHGDSFREFSLNFNYINELIGGLQDIIEFDIIQTEKIDKAEIDGIIIFNNIVKYVFKHRRLTDCIHVEIDETVQLRLGFIYYLVYSFDTLFIGHVFYGSDDTNKMVVQADVLNIAADFYPFHSTVLPAILYKDGNIENLIVSLKSI